MHQRSASGVERTAGGDHQLEADPYRGWRDPLETEGGGGRERDPRGGRLGRHTVGLLSRNATAV